MTSTLEMVGKFRSLQNMSRLLLRSLLGEMQQLEHSNKLSGLKFTVFSTHLIAAYTQLTRGAQYT